MKRWLVFFVNSLTAAVILLPIAAAGGYQRNERWVLAGIGWQSRCDLSDNI